MDNGFQLHGSTWMQNFLINMQLTHQFLGFASADLTTCGSNTDFLICGWESAMQQADWRLCSLPGHRRNLSICRF